MRQRLRQYILENKADLLNLDLSLARVLGAPAPHTLSSWAYKKSRFWTVVIDLIWRWLFSVDNHCKAEYEKTLSLSSLPPSAG